MTPLRWVGAGVRSAARVARRARGAPPKGSPHDYHPPALTTQHCASVVNPRGAALQVLCFFFSTLVAGTQRSLSLTLSDARDKRRRSRRAQSSRRSAKRFPLTSPHDYHPPALTTQHCASVVNPRGAAPQVLFFFLSTLVARPRKSSSLTLSDTRDKRRRSRRVQSSRRSARRFLFFFSP